MVPAAAGGVDAAAPARGDGQGPAAVRGRRAVPSAAAGAQKVQFRLTRQLRPGSL